MSVTSARTRMLRPFFKLALALVAGTTLTACGGGTGPSYGDGGDDGGGEATGDIQMVNSTFRPQVDTVSVGTTVTWVNDDGVNHTVTADGGGFDSGTVGPNATFQHTFSRAGTVPYHCEIHGQPGAGMHGTLVVE